MELWSHPPDVPAFDSQTCTIGGTREHSEAEIREANAELIVYENVRLEWKT